MTIRLSHDAEGPFDLADGSAKRKRCHEYGFGALHESIKQTRR